MTGKSICIQLCFCMFVFVLPDVDSVPDGLKTKLRQFQEYHTQIESVSVLEHGDRCHSEEVKVTDIDTSKKVLEKLLKFDVSSFSSMGAELDDLNEMFKQFLSTGQKLCNGYKLFACDNSSNLCSCGPTRLSNREFSYTRDPEGRCLWAIDTPCFPVDDTQSKISNYCANESKCVFINDEGANIYCGFPNINEATIVRYDGTLERPECYCKAKSHSFHPQQSSTSAITNQTNSCQRCLLNIILFKLFPALFIFHAVF